MSRLEAVIETPVIEVNPPWQVSDTPAFSFLRLWRQTTLSETGLVMYQLAKISNVEFENTASDVLRLILSEEHLSLVGGLRVQDTIGTTINPGCCCDLGDWREWEKIITDGEFPWLGHDPWPWIERADNAIRIWADVDSKTSIDIPEDELADALYSVQLDLTNFLICVKEWAETIDRELAYSLVDKLDRDFLISPRLNLEGDVT